MQPASPAPVISREAQALSAPPWGYPHGAATLPKVSVVIPTLNEAENLPHTLPRIPAWVHEVILVDGLSTDKTVDVARRLRPGIRVIMQRIRGKGAALRAGCRAASGDIIAMLDADGSTDPAELSAFLGVLMAGAGMAKGSRFIQGGGTADMPLYRRLGNGLLVMLANILFGMRYTDITYGYNAVWRHNLSALALDIDGWPCEIVSNIRAIRLGVRVVEVASFEHRRIAGMPKLATFPAGWAILKGILREAAVRRKPIHFAESLPAQQGPIRRRPVE